MSDQELKAALERLRDSLIGLGVDVERLEIADKTFISLVMSLANDFADRAMRLGLFPEVDFTQPRPNLDRYTQYAQYFLNRMFPEVGAEADPDPALMVEAVPGSMSAEKAADFSGIDIEQIEELEGQIWLMTELIAKDPSLPTRRDRYIAYVSRYINAGFAPASLLSEAATERPRFTTGYLQKIWDATHDAEDLFVKTKVFNSFPIFISDTQIAPLSRGETTGIIVTSYDAHTKLAGLPPEIAALITQEGGMMNRAYTRLLANIGVNTTDLDTDMKAKDVAAAIVAFDQTITSTGGDVGLAKQAAVRALLQSGLTAQKRTAIIKLQQERQAFINERFSNPERIVKLWAYKNGIELDEELGLVLRAHLEKYQRDFDITSDVMPSDPFGVLDAYMVPFIGGVRADQFASEREAEAKEFSLVDLQEWMADQDIKISPEDQKGILRRVLEIGVNTALAEVENNREQFGNRAEAQVAQANPEAFIRQRLVDAETITPDSDPLFLANLEEKVIGPIGYSLSIAFAEDPTLSGPHLIEFVQQRLDRIAPRDISEGAFKGAKRVDFPPQFNIDAATGRPIRKPTAPTISSSVLRPLISQLAETERPAFLSFLLQREPELVTLFAGTQVPRIDEAVFDEQLKKLMAIQRGVKEWAQGIDLGRDRPGARFRQEAFHALPKARQERVTEYIKGAQTSGFRTLPLGILQQEARRVATVTPPTAGEFFQKRLPGLRAEFQKSAPQIVERARVREQEQLREEEQLAQRPPRQRSALTIFRRGRRAA